MVRTSRAGSTGLDSGVAAGVGAGAAAGGGMAEVWGGGFAFVLVLVAVVVIVGEFGEVFHALEFGGGDLEGAFLGVGGFVGETGGDGDDGVDASAAQVVAQGALVAGDEHQFGERVLFGVRRC